MTRKTNCRLVATDPNPGGVFRQRGGRSNEKVQPMKNIIIVILLLVAVAVGGMWFQKHRQATQAEARLEALQKEAAELQASITQREEGVASLREKLEKSVVESAVNAGQAAQLSQALTNRLQAAAPPEANAISSTTLRKRRLSGSPGSDATRVAPSSRATSPPPACTWPTMRSSSSPCRAA